ncbi:hypothetical protein NIIDNTM18_42910 [Mycolicibacterium litorale]|uniref:Uncharacterized protein n=1 Tax=Mycolicibacterium litorale TaxID=758802 RepID=A0A6S6P569_9MYCO|nr:hypothetical protein NIIDNTM18_42910 [Mycolicibacterium litorale]
MKARRLELQKTPGEVVAEAEVDPKTYARLEDGTRWPQERSRLKIEAALEWEPGSIGRLLDGGDATPITTVPSTPAATQDAAPTGDETGVWHLLAHMWRAAEDLVSAVLDARSPTTVLLAAQHIVDLYGIYLTDHVISLDVPAEVRDAALADLFRKRDQARKKLGERLAVEIAPSSGAQNEGGPPEEDLGRGVAQKSKKWPSQFGTPRTPRTPVKPDVKPSIKPSIKPRRAREG